MINALASARLRNQRLTSAGLRRPEDVVEWFGAVQAQEYEAAKWGIALRMRGRPLDAVIERAVNDGRILRTHVMRPTWHLVCPSDIRWLLDLTAARVQRAASTYNRALELDSATLRRGCAVIEKSLRDGRYKTRSELAEELKRAGLSMSGQRLAGMVMHAELERIVCSGPRRDGTFTYGLLDERAPDAVRLPRDEALATLGRRFLQGHAPATVRDFVWWSGLVTADAKRAFEMIAARRIHRGDREYWIGETVPRAASRAQLLHLLPIYDEYLVAHRDRDEVPFGHAKVSSRLSGPVSFQHAIVIGGQVAGTWRTTRKGQSVSIHVVPSRRLSPRERRALAGELDRFGRFVSVPMSLTID